MKIRHYLEESIQKVLSEVFSLEVGIDELQINVTRPEFAGHYTLVVFPLAGRMRMPPPTAAEKIGAALLADYRFTAYNVVKGFLNLTIDSTLWMELLEEVRYTKDYGQLSSRKETVMVEFSSPNTNKPLHLGHVRNILLGWSMYEILRAAGYQVLRTQIINDRGIAICKSMLAWEKWGNGKTPESANMKGDHLVGEFYVLFETEFRKEYMSWQETRESQRIFEIDSDKGESAEAFFGRYKNQYFNSHSTLGAEARQMLRKWEEDDPYVVELWRRMNQWVYDGFEKTYERLGVSFDHIYYESETYLLGKSIVAKGLDQNLFYKKDDGSVWVDLEEQKMDHKILQRSDGTSVYITQDLGTAEQRYEDHDADRMVYVVADEQNYHFDVLFAISELLKRPYAGGMHHLSYGMVELPHGKMKSREGTVVDADDLMDEVISEARAIALEKGEVNSLSKTEQQSIVEKIGMAALKYHMVRVQPQRRMVFDPEESVDMQGQTGPYIQNAYVRIQSILRRSASEDRVDYYKYSPSKHEMDLLVQLSEYPEEIGKAAEAYDPSIIANFAYRLAKLYHKFYNEHRVLSAESDEAKEFRLGLSQGVANVLSSSMNLLGIQMPDKM
ncbi:arginine--tRNA ligase [Membranicola marinus]|uniref:Arginine--tRNA ligase n=1 Tax=Membranihabitans marinus TaxID=1227546 RepID=A0A953HXY3_9BACT|nr:arginine--tRNA ligase [Membranihabitans marinus]MBY5960186.1 arginine--tRNA ligase [Membranihabitans marinus]